MRSRFPFNKNVCIVGGGPAGLAAAIALQQRGYKSLVVERAIPPVDKACGEGLLPDSRQALSALGVRVPATAGFNFQGIRFTDNHSSTTATFPTGSAVGLRRLVLHGLLADHAQKAGVDFCWGAKDVHLVREGVAFNGRIFKAGLVVAADGQNSSLRSEAGLNEAVRSPRWRYGFRRHYAVPPWSPYVELHWGQKCQIYVTPVSPNEVGVALISRDPSLRLDRALADFPQIFSRLQGAAATTSERGSLSVSRTLRQVSRDGFALIGDASGSVDALTGEGLGLAFRQSLALAEALEAGDLRKYEVQHRRISRKPRLMAALMLLLDKRPNLQKRALASLAARPSVFQSLLAMHVGEGGLGDFLSWEALDFCRKFLTA